MDAQMLTQASGDWLAAWGHPAVFAAVLAEFLGLPVPSALALAAAAALPGEPFSPAALIATACAAALIGDSAWYLAGRRRGKSLIELYCTVTLGSASCTRNTRSAFAKLGPRSLAVAKFVPGLSSFAAPMSGLLKVPYPIFVGWDLTGTFLWAGLFVWIGRRFGAAALRVLQGGLDIWSGRLLWALLISSVLFVAMKWLRRRRLGPAASEQISE